MSRRRDTTHIVLHCADTPNGDPGFTVDDIRRWHVKERGWSDIGYHYVIHVDGKVASGRGEDEVGAHCKGLNIRSVGVCMVGRNKFTVEQWSSLEKLSRELLERYEGARIIGHNERALKECPGFSVQDWYKKGLAPMLAHICKMKGE